MFLQSHQHGGVCSGKLAFSEGAAPAVGLKDRVSSHGGPWPLHTRRCLQRPVLVAFLIAETKHPTRNKASEEGFLWFTVWRHLEGVAEEAAQGCGSGQARLLAHISAEQEAEREMLVCVQLSPRSSLVHSITPQAKGWCRPLSGLTCGLVWFAFVFSYSVALELTV